MYGLGLLCVCAGIEPSGSRSTQAVESPEGLQLKGLGGFKDFLGSLSVNRLQGIMGLERGGGPCKIEGKLRLREFWVGWGGVGWGGVP